MKFVFSLIFLSLISSCSTSKSPESASDKETPFIGMRGCFLLYNLKTQKFEKVVGETCKERFPACSSFKVALAVMAFDSGVLKDEKVSYKWDGKKRMLEAWNKDHNGKTWMKESVVWFSQRLTPKLGKKRFQSYLEKFNYGNEDISTGITQAWLNPPNDPKGFLGINAFEQVEFMKKLWTNKLPVSMRAMAITRNITFLETSPNGFKLSGKTGSNSYDPSHQFGWFISHVAKGDKEYIAVTNISDVTPVQTKSFGGPRAKNITKAMLKEAGLW